MTFSAGDVVWLKSGSQPMVVKSLDSENAVCIWSGTGQGTYPLYCISEFDPEPHFRIKANTTMATLTAAAEAEKQATTVAVSTAGI